MTGATLRRILILTFALLSFGVIPAHAQCTYTQVVGTITDPNAIPYRYGSFQVNLLSPGGGNPLCNGKDFPGHQGPIQLSATGSFALTMPANTSVTPNGTQWTFIVQSGATEEWEPCSLGPVSFSVNVTITGANQDISTTLSNAAAAQQQCGGGGFVGPHNLLSTTHLDTIPATPPTRGDVITGQNLTSPSGAHPAWSRLALGANTFVLTSNGTDAIWAPAPSGSGCTLPGHDTGVLSEHPVGTCYNSVNFTWNDGTNAQNMQAGLTNTINAGVALGFTFGSSNTLSGASNAPGIFVNGLQNSVSAVLGTANMGINVQGDQSLVNANTGTGNTGLYVWGLGHTLHNATFGVVVGGYNDGTGFLSGATPGVASGPGVILGESNTVAVHASDIISHFRNVGENNDMQGNTCTGLDIYGQGNSFALEGCTGGGGLIYGRDDHTTNSVGVTAEDIGIFGISNNSSNTTGGCHTTACGGFNNDTEVYGSQNTVTNAGAAILGPGVGLTLQSCDTCMVQGYQVSLSTNDTYAAGMSPSPEIVVSSPISSASTPYQTIFQFELPQNTATVSHLVKLSGAPSAATISATTDTNGVVGILNALFSSNTKAMVSFAGTPLCAFDGATTAGDYVQISSTTAGDCHDAGSSFPASGQVIGRILSTNAGSGTYRILFFSPSR